MKPKKNVFVGLGKNESRIFWQLMQMADKTGYACTRFNRSVHKDLALALDISSTTVWRICNELCRKGLIDRRLSSNDSGGQDRTQYHVMDYEIYTKMV